MYIKREKQANLILISMVYFGVHPSCRNMCFAQKHKKSLEKKMQALCKAMNCSLLRLPFLVKPKEVKPKVPIGDSCRLNRLASLLIPSSRRVLVPITKGLPDSAGPSPQEPRLRLRLGTCC